MFQPLYWESHHWGSGKTPMIAYLLHHFSDRFSLAVLSRGYKRKSSGFLIADATSSIESLGDEPFCCFKSFEGSICGLQKPLKASEVY